MLLEDFGVSFQPLNQVTPLAGGTNPFRTPRGNVNVAVQLAVTIPYSTTANAVAAIATLRTAFSVKKHLKVEQGATVHYYPNALLNSYNPVLRGVTVLHQFNFTTDDLTASAP